MDRKLWLFLCLVVALGMLVLGARLSRAWEVEVMNKTVNQTNFIVSSGCSGTLISLKHRLITTAYHCVRSDIRQIDEEKVVDGEVKKVQREVRDEVNVEQKFYDGSSKVGSASFQTSIVAYNKNHDLALLQMKQKDIPQTLEVPVLPMGKEMVRGAVVWLIGNPAGLDATVTTGIISSVTREMENPNGSRVAMLQSDAGAYFGSSGGSMVDDKGQLVGVIARGIPGASVVLAVHYKHIRKLLDEACYGEVWDSTSKSHDVCIAEKKAKAEKAKK